jgi:hypothetical protein
LTNDQRRVAEHDVRDHAAELVKVDLGRRHQAAPPEVLDRGLAAELRNLEAALGDHRRCMLIIPNSI